MTPTPNPAKTRGLSGFSFEVDGEVQVSLALNRMIRAVSDLRPFAPAFQSAFSAAEAQQFASQGAAGRSGAWAALSEPYASRKRARFGDKPILQAAGALMKALTGGNTLLISEPMLLGFGAVVDYGIFHQRGTGKMPARKPISIGREQETRLFGRALGEMARALGYMWTGGTTSRYSGL